MRTGSIYMFTHTHKLVHMNMYIRVFYHQPFLHLPPFLFHVCGLKEMTVPRFSVTLSVCKAVSKPDHDTEIRLKINRYAHM